MEEQDRDIRLAQYRAISELLWKGALAVTVFPLVLLTIYFWPTGEQLASEEKAAKVETPPKVEEPAYWQPVPLEDETDAVKREELDYGKELVMHTAEYLGPKGSVYSVSNGLNCQNCHLDAGTKPFGNNFGAVASTYPMVRGRSGKEENVSMRLADCFDRSMNASAPIDTSSREVHAIRAYILHVGSNVPKGERAPGTGLKDMPYLDRAADPEKGKTVYVEQCQSCHQADGEGLLNNAGTAYTYPPLWGDQSYNVSAGLYRVTTFARYVKYNMPLGASHKNPILSDKEAYDVAAFVNSMPRQDKRFPNDWPDIAKKRIDHPFGPYADEFSEEQHKYGPFAPIAEARKKNLRQ